MTLFFDPSIWAGFFTLIVLEIVLGIDNLVFIAIITDKLLPKKRDKARLIGLSLALIMRIGLLSLISWIVTLTHPIFILGKLNFSGRNLILLVGGLFLLFKAIFELHERLENHGLEHQSNKHCANFWAVVIQIVILDALFSLDAIITAVGMVNNLPVMMMAVAIAMGIMLLASNPLTQFINAHPTVVVLCLSFLLMIGLSLIAEGFGFNVPKGYLYAAIGFSILIELFNQIASRNFLLQQERRPMRERTAEIILRIIGEYQQNNQFKTNEESVLAEILPKDIFKDEERYLINRILTLSQRSITSIMVPRDNIIWVDISHSLDDIRIQLLEKPYSIFPICEGTLDKIIGVVKAIELLKAIEFGIDIVKLAVNSPAVMVSETLDMIHLLHIIHQAKGTIVIVTNKFGIVQGLVSPLDILEVLIGGFSKNN